MTRNKLFSALLATSLIAVPATRAAADAGDLFLGIIGGAIIGGAINQQQRNNARTAPRPAPSGQWSAQRQENAQMQRALNDFGYNVGSPDGVVGRNTRNGISRFQGDMGFPVTGEMNQFQRDFLFNSHSRFQNGAGSVPPYSQALATQGPPGLLRAFRNEQMGIPNPGAPTQAPAAVPNAPIQAALPQPVPLPAPVPAPQVVTPAAQPQPNASNGLPVFNPGQMARSVNQHCNEVGILTTTNGGFMDAASVTDAKFALNEQFCLARAFAVQDSTRIVQSIAGVSQQQIESGCAGIPAFMANQMTGLGTTPPAAVTQATAATLQSSGQTTAQLVSTGKICLGVGYKTDEPRVALAAALILVGANQPAYGEMVGHHLREGFGIDASDPQGAAWISSAVTALEQGAEPAFLPGQSAGRVAVLKTALNGGGGAPAAPTAGLPTFLVPATD